MSLETSQQVAQLPRVPALTYLSDGWWPGSVSQTKSFLPSLLLVRVFYHSNTNKAMTCFETLSQSKSLSLNCFCGAFGYHDERGSFVLLNFISQERWTDKRRAAGPGKGTGKWGWCMFRNFFFLYCKEMKGLKTWLYYTVLVKITLPQLCIFSSGENARMSQLPGIMMKIGCIIYLQVL